MAVRILAVAKEIARELDLVRRVVREEPRRARLAQARLENDRRHGQQANDSGCNSNREPARPRRTERRGGGCQRDDQTGEQRGCPDGLRVPGAVRAANEGRERTRRVDGPGPEVPGFCAERRNGHEHEHAERAEEQPEIAARQPVSRVPLCGAHATSLH